MRLLRHRERHRYDWPRPVLRARRSHAIFVLTAVIVVSCGFPRVAWAYVDPSVMTYTIQAVAGVAVALSAVAGVLFRRTRRAVMKRLGIDEDARKQKEGPVHRLDKAGIAVAEGEVGAVASSPQASVDSRAVGGSKGDPRGSSNSWHARLRAAVFPACFLAFTLLVVAPIEMVAGSAGSLIVGVEQVWPSVIGLASAVAVLLAAALTLIPERVAAPARIVVVGLGVCCWLQAMFLNFGLPSADGVALDWGSYSFQMVVSAVVWLAVIAGALVVCLKAPRNLVSLGATAVACALVIVQGVGLVSLFAPGSASQDLRAEMHDYATTEKGMFTVSSEKNVIVFVLDTYDTEHLMAAVSDEPGLLDDFSGFTWYQNSTAAMIPTRYGVPFLLTGQLPHEDEKFSQFLAERYSRSDYLDRIASTGATMGIYSDTLGLQYVDDEKAADLVYSKAFNFMGVDDLPIDHFSAAAMLARCALYRDLPWLAKPVFWFYTDEVNNALIARGEEDGREALNTTPYLMSDSRWYGQLREYGLELDERSDAPAFRFIHLLGTHQPYIVDENGADVGSGESTLEQQARGSMRMVGFYLDELKQLGVYDQTTIVITADHGNYYHILTPLEDPATPIMLVKPAFAPDESIAVSRAAVSAADVMPTVLASLGADSEGYGVPIWQISDPDRSRRYLMTTSDGSHDQEILEYEIIGDALDIDNWHLTGQSWAAQE